MPIGFAVSVTQTVLDEVMLISPRFVPIDLPKCVQFSYKLSQKYKNEIRVLDSNGESIWSSKSVGKWMTTFLLTIAYLAGGVTYEAISPYNI